MKGRLLIASVAAGAALAVAAVPAVSAATTFGADLTTQTPNATFDCGAGWPIPSSLAAFGFAAPFQNAGSPSCTWTSIDTTNPARSMYVPGTGAGTIADVRVSVGPTTGPMQVVVLRQLTGLANGGPGLNLNAACCVVVETSAPFTPAANAVSTIPVNLPVENDVSPLATGQPAGTDILGLSVLRPGVPVPLFFTGDDTSTFGVTDDAWFPAQEQPTSDVASPTGDPRGYQLLMSADFVPAAAAPQAPATPNVPTLPAVQLPGGGVRFDNAGLVDRANRADVGRVTDPPTVATRQTLRALLPAAGKRLRLVVVGAGTTTVPAHRSRALTVRLNRTGRAALRRKGRLAVAATVVARGANGRTQTLRRSLVLRRRR